MATQDFKNPEDIANRALQILGGTRIASFSEASKNASTMLFAYDKIRKAELRRNIWRFAIKRCVLRATTPGTATIVPPSWDAVTTWATGAIVTDTSGDWWQAKYDNSNQSPAQGSYWRRYASNDYADPWDYSGSSTYYAGEIVIVPATWSSGTTYAIGSLVRYATDGKYYVALLGTNLNNIPSTATTYWMLYASWVASTVLNVVPPTYVAGYTAYLSISSNNIQNPVSTTGQWISLGAAVQNLRIIYPIGTGPAADLTTNNVYRLPRGFLRQAPDDPKANLPGPSLGAVLSPLLDDYVWEDNYIISALSGIVMLRFVSDFVEVASMDPMFCEGLANRLAEETCEELNQDSQKVTLAIKKYAQIMWEARMVNAIEQGAAEPALDTYISCRF